MDVLRGMFFRLVTSQKDKGTKKKFWTFRLSNSTLRCTTTNLVIVFKIKLMIFKLRFRNHFKRETLTMLFKI